MQRVVFALFLLFCVAKCEKVDVPTIPVYITTSLLDIRTIDDKGASFEAEVEWVLEWERVSDVVNDDNWIPKIISENKVKGQLEHPLNVLKFENKTKMIMRERSEWSFEFYFRNFPFDSQEPHIFLQPEVSEDYVVVLIPTQIGSRSKELLVYQDNFHVEGWSNFRNAEVDQFTKRSITGAPVYGYVLKLETDREYGSYLVQNIFPAAIFVCIAFAGFWMDFTALMPRLMPILFATVALANLNSSTSKFITRGGDVSFFEAFALSSTIISALVLVELVIVHNLGRKKLREVALLVDKVCRFAFPTVYIIISFFLVLLLAIEAPLWSSLLFLFGCFFLLVLFTIFYLSLRFGYYVTVKKKKQDALKESSS